MFHYFNNLTVMQLIQLLEHYVVIASIVTLLMPPVEWFDQWPRFQKGYRFFLMVILHYSSINFRSKLWNFTPQGQQANQNVPTQP